MQDNQWRRKCETLGTVLRVMGCLVAGPEYVWQVSENSDDTCSPRPDCKGLPGHAKGCVLPPGGNGEALKDFRAEECYSHICILQNAMKAVQDDCLSHRRAALQGHGMVSISVHPLPTTSAWDWRCCWVNTWWTSRACWKSDWPVRQYCNYQSQTV